MNKRRGITEATQEYGHGNKRSLLIFVWFLFISFIYSFIIFREKKTSVWCQEWRCVRSGCFSAITKPLKQRLPAVLVATGFSDHTRPSHRHLLSFFFVLLDLFFFSDLPVVYVAGYQYRLNHSSMFYFEVKVAYFLWHLVKTYFHHTPFLCSDIGWTPSHSEINLYFFEFDICFW